MPRDLDEPFVRMGRGGLETADFIFVFSHEFNNARAPPQNKAERLFSRRFAPAFMFREEFDLMSEDDKKVYVFWSILLLNAYRDFLIALICS